MNTKNKYIVLTMIVFIFLIAGIGNGKGGFISVMLGVIDESISEPPKVALTFDDGPHILFTPKLLEGLEERGVCATFFILGKNIEGKEDILKEMQENGNLIGNHTFNHVRLTEISSDAACSEIWKSNTSIFDATGKIPIYVRPPFGSWDEELTCLVDMQVVLWDVDPLDWKTQNVDQIVNHVLKNVKDGDIILLHDVYETSVEAAFRIVDELTFQGYEFVTVDEILLD